MPIRAVLTGDIVNSTKLVPVAERKLLRGLQQVMQSYQFEFYRGDSFQVYLKDPAKSLWLALVCRTTAISSTPKGSLQPADIRMSIGLGPVGKTVRSLSSAKGEAFLLSGRSFDALEQTGKRLTIISNNHLVNLGLEVIADYLNAIYKDMTAKQAEVILKLLQSNTQRQIATRLKKSKSTIHQRATAARWPEIEKLLLQYEKVINELA